jgi:uncharacterized protein (DUF305 family)
MDGHRPDPGLDIAATDDEEPDDTIVLPWWQRPANIVIVVVAVALIAGMVGWLVADTQNEVAASDVDVGFLQDMSEHHRQAVDMSFSYLTRPDADPRLAVVARSIIFEQAVEIGVMLQQLAEMGAPALAEDGQAMAWMGHPMDASEMPGMATEEQLDALATASGREADELFVELMTAHHRGGIEMAEDAAARADSDAVIRMAGSTIRNQQDEIIELENLQADPVTD